MRKPKNVFNELYSREKWDTWKEQEGSWHCPQCGSKMTDGPNRASPFHGAQVLCGGCDSELTRRTGGGQGDPFNWILKLPAGDQKRFTITRRRTVVQISTEEYLADTEEDALKLANDDQEENQGANQEVDEWTNLDDVIEYPTLTSDDILEVSDE